MGPKPEKLGKWLLLRRVYELSCIGEIADKVPYRAPFRELANRIQLMDNDIEKTLEKYTRTMLLQRLIKPHSSLDARRRYVG